MPRNPRETPDGYVPGDASPEKPQHVNQRLADDLAEAQQGKNGGDEGSALDAYEEP